MKVKEFLRQAEQDKRVALLLELIRQATNWQQFAPSMSVLCSAAPYVSKIEEWSRKQLRMGRKVQKQLPSIIEVLKEAEKNRCYMFYFATSDLGPIEVEKVGDVMESPFKDERLYATDLNRLVDFLSETLFQYVTYPKRVLLIRPRVLGEEEPEAFKDYENEAIKVWRQFHSAIKDGDLNTAERLGEELLKFTWGSDWER